MRISIAATTFRWSSEWLAESELRWPELPLQVLIVMIVMLWIKW